VIVFRAPAADQERYNRLIEEHLVEEQASSEWESLVEARFPPMVWLQHRDRCEEAALEVLAMTRDGFPHVLEPLHEHFLYWAIDWWLDGVIPREGQSPEERAQYGEQEKELSDLQDVAFDSVDFLHVDEIAVSVLEGNPYNSRLGIIPERYLDLMPDDIRRRVETTMKEGGP